MTKTKLFMAITCALTASLAFSAAAYSGGDGSSQNPYLISNASDLTELAEESLTNSFDDVYFVQTANISVDGELASIATDAEYPFMGSYNGLDYDITGAELFSGLFVYAKDASLLNIELRDAAINVSAVSGGIVANALGETVVESCVFDGSAVLPSSSFLGCNAGGIAGNVDKDVLVKECVSALEINVEHSPLVLYAGGIAGYNKGNISECTAKASFVAVSDNYIVSLGGIAGENEGVISGCETTGSISGQIINDVAFLYIGGIAGHNNGGTIERTVNKASLNAEGYNEYPGYIGGIAGYNQNGDIEISSNNGKVGGDINYAGGVTGINYASDGTALVNECLNAGEITVTNGITGGLVGGNLATDKSENVSTVSSSLNLYDELDGNGAIGAVQTDFVGVSAAKDLVVRNLTDSNAETMTDEALKSADSISKLTSSAWVYPKDGFLPSLAVVKNLNKVEVIATAVDSENSKVAFTVYNPGNETSAVALISFCKGGRLTGTKLVNITASNGYSVHTAESSFAAQADSVKVTVFNNLTSLGPVAESDSF